MSPSASGYVPTPRAGRVASNAFVSGFVSIPIRAAIRSRSLPHSLHTIVS